MKLTYLLTILFLNNILFSQNTKIKLLDSNTKEPVFYANIILGSLQNHKKMYLISSINGEFTNSYSEKMLVTISLIGYKTLTDTLLPSESKTIFLIPDVFNLEQVVVTATRTNKMLKNTPVITQVINANDIQTKGYTKLENVLENELPGLDFQQVGYGTDINMHGLSSKNILILVDGEKLAGENGNNIDYSRINTSDIDRIEIVKGASSALYGSQAMGGVINIITKKTKKHLELNIVSKLTERNQVNYKNVKITDDNYKYKLYVDMPNIENSATIGLNFYNVSSRTNFSRKSFDGYKLIDLYSQSYKAINIDTTIVYPKEQTNVDGFQDYTISQTLSYNLKSNFNVNLYGSYYNHNQYDFNIDNKYQNYEDITYGGNIVYKFNDKFNLKAFFNRDEYNKYDYLEKLFEKKINYKNVYVNPKIVADLEIFNRHSIIIGSEYFAEGLLSDKYIKDTLTNQSINNYVFYFQDDIVLNEKINFVIGVRADVHSTFGLYPSPKLSAMYRIKSNVLRFNYAKGFRSPTLKELYMNWDMLGMFTIKGDVNLKPETNNYISLSYEYTQNNFNVATTFYKNWIINKIDGEWQENQTVYKYVNIYNAELSGVEVLLRYKFLKHVNFGGGYSFVVDNRSAESQISTISPHSATVKIEYNFSKSFYTSLISINGKITGAKNYQDFADILYRGENVKAIYNVHYNAFSIWNLSFSQKIYNSTNLIFGVNNIFDYKPDLVNFNTSINPGRRVFVSLQINIDNFFNNKQKLVKWKQ